MPDGGRILVVEDYFLVAEMLAEHLVRLGCEPVGPTAHVQPALDLANREHLDGALLDIDLDGESGIPVAEALRQRGIPIIFLSGHAEDMLPPEFRNEIQLTKPVRAATLEAALAKIGAVKARTELVSK